MPYAWTEEAVAEYQRGWQPEPDDRMELVHCGGCNLIVADDAETVNGEPFHGGCLGTFRCSSCHRTQRLAPVHDDEALPCACGGEMRLA